MEPAPSATPVPTETLEPADPLAILDAYASLEPVRQRLDAMTITKKQDGSVITGRQMIEWLLVTQQYDPTAANDVNEQLFANLDGYAFPHPGARIYLINVATSLYVEAHRLVPWSLENYSPYEIRNLFIEDDTFKVRDHSLHHGDLPDMPNTTWYQHPLSDKIVEDAHYKQFNLALRITKDASTQQEAIEQIIGWIQQNFFHAIAPDYGWEVYLDGREPLNTGGPVAFPTSIERIYEERVSGCHIPTVLQEGMLHSLNIPAVRVMIHGHGVLYLPTLDRYVHGDHILGGTNVPPGIRLYTPDEIRPFAENADWIFQIARDKYQVTLPMPLYRDGDYLYIYADKVFQADRQTCIEISKEEWARMAEQVSSYNVRYDTENCVISSDRVPIRTLTELSAPDP
jgi:hypothetical protein